MSSCVIDVYLSRDNTNLHNKKEHVFDTCGSEIKKLRGGAFTSVCLCVRLFFHIISQKPMQLGSPKLTYKCSTMSPGNSFIWGESRGSLHSCECRLLLVRILFRTLYACASVGVHGEC